MKEKNFLKFGARILDFSFKIVSQSSVLSLSEFRRENYTFKFYPSLALVDTNYTYFHK